MTSVQIGSQQRLVLQKNGETKEVTTLQNVKFVPELWTNLRSITSAPQQ